MSDEYPTFKISENALRYQLVVADYQLRDALALAALAGILTRTGAGSPQSIASYAYEVADAMLAAREVKS